MDLKQLLNQTTIIDNVTDNVNNETLNDDKINDESSTDDKVNDESSTDDKINDDKVIDETTNDDTIEKPEIDERFKVSWNKLEKGQKLNRILLFIKQETEEKELSITLSKELKNILFNACDRGLFNKVSDVSYNIETGLIESFKCLEFNESSKKYKLKSNGTKNRSVSKSRSNIDRLAKKKS